MFKARIIEVTSADALVGYESPQQQLLEDANHDLRLSPSLVVIPRDQIESIAYTPLAREPQSHSDSFAQEWLGLDFPPMCSIPNCEWDTTEETESEEPSFSPPFAF